MPYRLYLVNTLTGRKTGKKRDYASLQHLKLYGKDTYERYNMEYYFTNNRTNTRAELCFLNDENRWEVIPQESIKSIFEK